MTALRYTLVSGFFLLGACSQFSASRIEIQNDGNVPLSAVDVQLGGKRYKVDLIEPKGVAGIAFEPASDSDVRIEYVSQGRKQTCVSDVYVTTGLRMQISISILPGQGCTVDGGEIANSAITIRGSEGS
jgi:hypothetical protein